MLLPTNCSSKCKSINNKLQCILISLYTIIIIIIVFILRFIHSKTNVSMTFLGYPGDSSYGGSVESNQQAPRFLSEPASRIHFVNTAGVLIHCGQVAGIPSPTVQWVTAGDGQPVTTVHNLRTTFPNGTLYLQSFQANRYRQDVHATTYRCVATNSVGTTGSRDVRVRAGKFAANSLSRITE